MPEFVHLLVARTSPWILVLVLALLIAVGFWAGIRAGRWVLRRRVARTRRVGRRGHARALRLLERAGYRPVQTEATARGRVQVDGETNEYVVRADALVRRRGRLYVAELKGGAGSASVLHRETRRQLLEYALLFDVDGVLLVDAASQRILHVVFLDLAARDRSGV